MSELNDMTCAGLADVAAELALLDKRPEAGPTEPTGEPDEAHAA